jgi:hypothetical protein
MALPVSFPLAIIAIVLGVTARRHARRGGGNPRIGTSAIVLGVACIALPFLLWSVLFSTRSESHVDPPEQVFTTETVPAPSSTTVP